MYNICSAWFLDIVANINLFIVVIGNCSEVISIHCKNFALGREILYAIKAAVLINVWLTVYQTRA